MSRRMIPPLRGRIDACTDPTVMKQTRINQLDVGEESIDELLGLCVPADCLNNMTIWVTNIRRIVVVSVLIPEARRSVITAASRKPGSVKRSDRLMGWSYESDMQAAEYGLTLANPEMWDVIGPKACALTVVISLDVDERQDSERRKEPNVELTAAREIFYCEVDVVNQRVSPGRGLTPELSRPDLRPRLSDNLTALCRGREAGSA